MCFKLDFLQFWDNIASFLRLISKIILYSWKVLLLVHGADDFLRRCSFLSNWKSNDLYFLYRDNDYCTFIWKLFMNYLLNIFRSRSSEREVRNLNFVQVERTECIYSLWTKKITFILCLVFSCSVSGTEQSALFVQSGPFTYLFTREELHVSFIKSKNGFWI